MIQIRRIQKQSDEKIVKGYKVTFLFMWEPNNYEINKTKVNCRRTH